MADDGKPPRGGGERLSRAQREEVLARLQAGENGSDLAREFGITRQGVNYLKQQQRYHQGERPNPPRAGGKPHKFKLPEHDWSLIKQQLRSTGPADHGLGQVGDAAPGRWTVERALRLALASVGRMPSRWRMQAVLREVFPPDA